MRKSLLALGGVVSTVVLTLPNLLSATELLTPPHSSHAGIRAPAYCGPCGCVRVAYSHHRELRSTYGLSFDPRNYDATEPHYYLGRMRAYPQYYVEGWSFPGSC